MSCVCLLQECKVTRKYGVESTTTITLLDPAAFFAAAAEPAAKAADGEAAPDVEAGEGRCSRMA